MFTRNKSLSPVLAQWGGDDTWMEGNQPARKMDQVNLCRTSRFQVQCGCLGPEAAEEFTSAHSRAIGASFREHDPAVLSTRTTHDQVTRNYLFIHTVMWAEPSWLIRPSGCSCWGCFNFQGKGIYLRIYMWMYMTILVHVKLCVCVCFSISSASWALPLPGPTDP